jgi:eukaryotic-like serine/threonine-protein kinase
MLCATCGHDLDDARSAPCPRCAGPTLLDDRYALSRALGAGAHGTTYQATRLSDQRQVAIKELPTRSLDTLKTHQLFEREARVLQQLDHPHIPRFHELFAWGMGKNQALYLVEELVEGHTLAQELASRRHDEADVMDILDAVLHILIYLHSRTPPVIHRDIKPENIMRDTRGALLLVDFGAVHDALAPPGSTLVGTFGYMAPELFMGQATPASDLYAVGALACALLTRQPPHALMDHAHTLRLPDQLPARPALRALITALIAPDPADRPANAQHALDALRDARAAAPGALERVAPAPLTRRPDESLFGLYAMVFIPPLLATPCLLTVIGPLATLSVMGAICLLVIFSVPFMRGDEG